MLFYDGKTIQKRVTLLIKYLKKNLTFLSLWTWKQTNKK